MKRGNRKPGTGKPGEAAAFAAVRGSRSPCSISRSARAQCARGFTLLEVLAAIAVLAFAFAIGLRAMSGALGNSMRGAAITSATLEAQSLLDQQGLVVPLSAGVQQGRFADGAAWQLRTRKYKSPVPAPAAGFADSPAQPLGNGIDLFRLDLDVRYGGHRTLHFATLRAQQAQQP